MHHGLEGEENTSEGLVYAREGGARRKAESLFREVIGIHLRARSFGACARSMVPFARRMGEALVGLAGKGRLMHFA